MNNPCDDCRQDCDIPCWKVDHGLLVESRFKDLAEKAINDIYKIRRCAICANHTDAWNARCESCDRNSNAYHPDFKWRGEEDNHAQNELNVMLEAHKKWLNGEEGGQQADLQGADLRGADLQDADIDYACWPLWCGSLDVRVDRRIFCQLAYHLCRVIVDDEDCKDAQLMLGRLANEFHLIYKCGRVPEKEDAQ